MPRISPALLLLLLPRRGRALAALAAKEKKRSSFLLAKAPPPFLRKSRPAVGVASAAALGLSAFSFFSQGAEKENGGRREEKREKATEEEEEEKEGEAAIVRLLKKAKLSITKGDLEEAERILHEATRLSRRTENKAAIIYTYDTMANLAFMRGQTEQAEKLFKAAMSYLLAGDTKEDDNAIIEMSLKLASIYAAQNQHKLALAGYEFCILTLEEKVAKQKDMPTDALTEEERNDTRLLLGMSLDSYARYLLAHGQAAVAQKMYERALRIATEVQGETHPQTVVLMSDLATALDAQGRYEDAFARVRKAAELARETKHPEAHIVLNNLAGILMHKEDYSQAKEVYQEALKQAEKNRDEASARYIRKELLELAKRKKRRSKLQEEDREGAGRE